MGGHTQEPWMLGARYPESHWIDVVSQTDERGLPFVSCKHHDEEANARRIVASVNATAGIPVEALEAGAIGELVEALRMLLTEARERGGGVSNGERLGCATLAKVKGDAA